MASTHRQAPGEAIDQGNEHKARVARALGRWWHRLRSDRVALTAAIVLGLIVLCAVVGPIVLTQDPGHVSLGERLIGPIWTKDGTWSHPLGTDSLGRDELAQLLRGARISLFIGVTVVVFAGTIGGTLGITAGYLGGRYENIVMRITEAWIAFPGLLLALLILLLVGPGILTLIIVISAATWMAYSRVAHDTTLTVRHTLYVRAAETLGSSKRRVLTRHVLPNVLSPFLTIAVFEFANVVLTEASLSYLGYGIQPPAISWGLMIANGQQYLQTASWLVVVPGLAIAILVLSLNILGNWARKVSDPRQGARRSRTRLAIASRSGRPGDGAETRPVGVPPADGSLLAVSRLTIEYPSGHSGFVPVVDDVSLEIGNREILGLVGESGAGKSVTSLALAGILPAPGVVRMESLSWRGDELRTAESQRAIVGSEITMVFQNPAASLDPLRPVGSQLCEVIRKHTDATRREADRRGVELLTSVGIAAATKRMHQLPHEFSGGMLQRVAIAIALAPRPRLLIADEPTTALDVTTQAQILHLLRDIRDETGVAILLVAHDLGVVAEMCDRVTVMYAGQIVEHGDVFDIFGAPAHPYTAGLIASTPRLDVPRGVSAMAGTVATAASGEGCRFAPRCRRAAGLCTSTTPRLSRQGKTDAACWHPLTAGEHAA